MGVTKKDEDQKELGGLEVWSSFHGDVVEGRQIQTIKLQLETV